MEPGGESGQDRVDAFNRSGFAKLLGMVITGAGDGYARVTMDAAGKSNFNGVAHGGAVFSLADQAFGIAANYRGGVQVAVSAYITYLAPSTGKLEAVAERVSESDGHSLYRVTVYDGKKVVAVFDGIGIRVPGKDGG